MRGDTVYFTLNQSARVEFGTHLCLIIEGTDLFINPLTAGATYIRVLFFY